MSDFSISPLQAQTGIKVVGELDVATAPQLAAVLDGLASQRELILDLSGVSFLDSRGLHAILAVAQARNGDGPIVIRPSQVVRRLFEVLALDTHPGLELQGESEPSS